MPKELRLSLDAISKKISSSLKGNLIRWVNPNKIHLTLKFLGNVSESNIPQIKGIIQSEAAAHKIFEISVGGLGVFPNMTHPRIIWVGVEAPEELLNLQRRIEGKIERLGYPPDKRDFSPHLTLGRVARSANSKQVRMISEVLRNCKVGFVGAARVTDIHLYKSELKPDGAVYSKLDSAQLAAN